MGDETISTFEPFQWFARWAEQRRLVTWERRCDEADVLIITNVWPHRARPTYGPFVRRSVEGLEALGIKGDVLFIRGYMGIAAYACGAIIVTRLGVRRDKY